MNSLKTLLGYLHRPDLVYLYAKNTNVNSIAAGLFLLVFSYSKLRDFQYYATVTQAIYMIVLYVVLFLFIVLYKKECKKILSNTQYLRKKFVFVCVKLTYYRTITVLSLLAICFWPLNSPYLYENLAGFAAAFSLLVLFSSVGSAYYLFLIYDTLVICGFVMLIIYKNLTGQTAEALYWAFGLLAVYGLILGWVINQFTRNILNTQKKLKIAAKRTEKAFKAKSEFLAVMSHEIRTPMNGIMGMVDFLGETNPTKEQKEYISAIEYCTKSLLNTLNDILDISKIEAGKLAISKVKIDFSDFLEKIKIVFANNANAKGITFTLNRDPSIPEKIYADPNRLSQIITNLLNNALKFTEKGFVTLAVSYDEKKGELKFSVQDSGIGIKKEDQNKLFQRFSQVDGSISRKFGGTGLGLSIVHSLVQEMNGDIGVQSALGEGSTFWFTLPYSEQDLANAEEDIDPEIADFDDSYFKGLNILVVDDNDLNQKIVRRYLENAGVIVTEAMSGQVAIDKANVRDYDIILMDLQMPDVDGYEATKRIKAIKKKSAPPIIALSANILKDTLQKCHEYGMAGHIAKPINKTELFSKIYAVLNSSFDADKKLVKDIINKEQIATIMDEFGYEYADEFIQSSFEEIDNKIVNLNVEIVNGQLEKARMHAHDLVSLAGNIGMTMSAKTASELEYICVNQNHEGSKDLFSKLRRLCLTEKKSVLDFMKQKQLDDE